MPEETLVEKNDSLYQLRIQQIDYGSQAYRDSVTLRDVVLRKPLGLAFTQEQLELESDSIHIACYIAEILVGCLILANLDSTCFKMRQVAVHPDYRGRGIASEMIKFAETLAKQKGACRIVLHARETAVSLYRRLDYQIEGEPFEEVTIPHRAMFKQLADL